MGQSVGKVGDALQAMIVVSEVFLKVGEIDDFTFLEVGVGQGCCKSFWVFIGSTASSSSTIVPLSSWRGATAPKRCRIAVTIGVSIKGEFHTGFGGTALRVNELKK